MAQKKHTNIWESLAKNKAALAAEDPAWMQSQGPATAPMTQSDPQLLNDETMAQAKLRAYNMPVGEMLQGAGQDAQRNALVQGADVKPTIYSTPQDVPGFQARAAGFSPEQVLGMHPNKDQQISANDKQTNRSNVTVSKSEPMDPELFRSTWEAINKLPFMKEQQASQADYNKSLGDYAQAPLDTRLDLTPLLSYADSLNKTNTAASYKGPAGVSQQVADKYKTILALKEKRQDNQKDLTNTMISALKSVNTGKTFEQKLAEAVLGSGVVDKNPTIPPRGAGGGKPYDPNKDVQKLGEARAKWAPSMVSALNNIDTALKDHGGIAGIRGGVKGDLPGVGLQAYLTPMSLLSGEGSALYQSAFDLAMAKLQARSGTQASEKEAQRYLKGLGLTPTSSSREFATGLTKLVDETKAQLAADESRFGVHKEVLGIYKNQPGAITSDYFDKYQTPGKAPAPSADEARMKELEKKWGFK